ncbi:IS630 family transposase [Emticicia agri]|uniref:IS630 family transposase n=2 Tax=Emticicia agri TaxID=2492393 RepID=UPI00286E6DF7|nr:IS630 family transposase [Emticicia agri]
MTERLLSKNIRAFFKNTCRASWKRARKSLKSKQNTSEYAYKEDCLNDLLELHQQSHIDLFYGDQAGFSLNCVVPYCWQFPDEPVYILPQKGKNINVFGLMNADGNELYTFDVKGTINADFVINSIEIFIDKIRKPTVLVIDNARIHHAKVFQEKLELWQNKGLYIFYLPAYSPHLNRIERLWRHTKYYWLKPSDYQDLETLKKALDKIWSKFGFDYQIDFSKIKI